jgi:hypothetical protein
MREGVGVGVGVRRANSVIRARFFTPSSAHAV